MLDNTRGPKTLNLERLTAAGFSVPMFFAITNTRVQKIWLEHEQNTYGELQATIEEAVRAIGGKLFAVRSSALLEDTGSGSQAGQFHTELRVTEKHMPEAILRVIQQAQTKLSGQLELFSIIIQEQISADMSGVLFTRDPVGGREMVIEYHRGSGEAIVGGAVHPKRVTMPWDRPAVDFLGKDILLESLVTMGKEVETLFDTPQDIEWCLKGEKIWLVQARPITSLNQEQFKQFQELDRVFEHEKRYYFEKTQLSEIAPRPTQATLSLLEALYQPDGPVSAVYREYGISFSAQRFLRILGNELFVDREAELHTLLPAYTFFRGQRLQPQPGGFSGLNQSNQNMKRLATLPMDWMAVYEPLYRALERPLSPSLTIQQALAEFLDEYKNIFRANLLAESAQQKLITLLKRRQLEISAINNIGPDHDLGIPRIDDQDWQGNALEFADTSPFSAHVRTTPINQGPTIPKDVLQAATLAATFARLREYGRWLTVRHVSRLRQALQNIGTKIGLPSDLHYFATLTEFSQNNFDQDLIQKRRTEYQRYAKWQLPARFVSLPIEPDPKAPLGVSAGKATGTLVSLASLEHHPGNDNILFTPMLTPDLVALFPRVKGILSTQGGTLSHLAIMAREHRLPVIVNVHPENLGLHFEDTIEIDGDGATIQVVASDT